MAFNQSNEPSFLARLSSSEPSFEYSKTGEQLLIYVLHGESTYTYLRSGKAKRVANCIDSNNIQRELPIFSPIFELLVKK
jgi:hypothetical protein